MLGDLFQEYYRYCTSGVTLSAMRPRSSIEIPSMHCFQPHPTVILVNHAGLFIEHFRYVVAAVRRRSGKVTRPGQNHHVGLPLVRVICPLQRCLPRLSFPFPRLLPTPSPSPGFHPSMRLVYPKWIHTVSLLFSCFVASCLPVAAKHSPDGLRPVDPTYGPNNPLGYIASNVLTGFAFGAHELCQCVTILMW